MTPCHERRFSLSAPPRLLEVCWPFLFIWNRTWLLCWLFLYFYGILDRLHGCDASFLHVFPLPPHTRIVFRLPSSGSSRCLSSPSPHKGNEYSTETVHSHAMHTQSIERDSSMPCIFPSTGGEDHACKVLGRLNIRCWNLPANEGGQVRRNPSPFHTQISGSRRCRRLLTRLLHQDRRSACGHERLGQFTQRRVHHRALGLLRRRCVRRAV